MAVSLRKPPETLRQHAARLARQDSLTPWVDNILSPFQYGAPLVVSHSETCGVTLIHPKRATLQRRMAHVPRHAR